MAIKLTQFAWSILNFILTPSFSFSSAELFQNIEEFDAKIYFTNRQIALTIQLFVAVKRNFSSLFFSEHIKAKGNSPFYLHINKKRR